MSSESKVSVIILAKDEEKSLPFLLRGLTNFKGEVLLIDGLSKDRTREIGKNFGIKVFSDQGKGKGEGIKLGAQKAKGEILVFIDADGSHHPRDIKALLKPIINGQADHVIGSRALGGSDDSHGTFYRFVRETASHLITVLINWRFKTDLSDSQNGFRAIRKDAFMALDVKENGFSIEQEILIKSLKKGFKVVEVPVHEYARRFGKSRIVLHKIWLRHLYTLFKYLYF